jgi:AcrR family transcriptional regulator
MARRAGTPNPNYEERRSQLLAALRARLIQPDQPYPSMRELAVAAGVTVPTLRHYFGRRDDLVFALLIDIGLQGEEHLQWTRQVDLPFDESIMAYVNYVAMGFRFGLTEIHTLGLREGLRHSRLGPSYIEALLEPTLQSIEDRLTTHQERGEMRPANVRHAALSLLSPILVAYLHQHELSGVGVRSLDLDLFAADHATAFARAYKL